MIPNKASSTGGTILQGVRHTGYTGWFPGVTVWVSLLQFPTNGAQSYEECGPSWARVRCAALHCAALRAVNGMQQWIESRNKYPASLGSTAHIVYIRQE